MNRAVPVQSSRAPRFLERHAKSSAEPETGVYLETPFAVLQGQQRAVQAYFQPIQSQAV